MWDLPLSKACIQKLRWARNGEGKKPLSCVVVRTINQND